MRILVSAFACQPGAGSEGGVGWRWVVELAKAHYVVVLTDPTRRATIEAELRSAPVANLRFEYFRPRSIRHLPLNSVTASFIYVAWQFGLLTKARSLHAKERFDLAWHLTYGVFRHPCFLGRTGIPLALGPVGGGEDAPWHLKRSLRGAELLKECARWAVNRLALVDPFLWIALSNTAWIFAKTEETREALPWPYRRRTLVYTEVGIDETVKAPAARVGGEPMRILFAGRLLGWKGVHLVLRAVAHALRSGVVAELTIVGRGPYRETLQKLSVTLKIDKNLEWIDWLPQHVLLERMATSHVFLFPSLHDSSGNVVLEAQSRGMPVVCLDLGGPQYLVTRESALIVRTGELNEEGVTKCLAGALELLFRDEAARRSMGEAAIHHARGMSWAARVNGALATIGVTR